MIKVLATLAVQGALPALIADYDRATGTRIASDFAPTNGLLARIQAGEAADVALLTRSALDDLEAAGVIAAGSIVDIALSDVGIAVKAGAPKPDISSVGALKASCSRRTPSPIRALARAVCSSLVSSNGSASPMR